MTLLFDCFNLTDTEAKKNPQNAIVVENMPSQTWSGRRYDIGLSKSGNLLVVQQGVVVGDQALFVLEPKLFFGVSRNKHVGDTFTSYEITQNFTEFDLNDYPNGLKVTLTQEAGGGMYKFAGVPIPGVASRK